jgi:hypothetical protein
MKACSKNTQTSAASAGIQIGHKMLEIMQPETTKPTVYLHGFLPFLVSPRVGDFKLYPCSLLSASGDTLM